MSSIWSLNGQINIINRVCRVHRCLCHTLLTVLLVTFEGQYNEGWREGGAARVIEEASQRLREKGWTAVRRALNITIRYLVQDHTEQICSNLSQGLGYAWFFWNLFR